jgi:MFS family permease
MLNQEHAAATSRGSLPEMRRTARQVALASAIGTTIEWYDFFIYGTAAAVVFGPQFFPRAGAGATLAAFAAFAVAFVARPLGGVVMGHYGDRIGRKSMLVWSLMLMGIATFAIGLLPNYARIGVWAPTLLVACRFIQGFALGGEWGGAVLMAVEHAPQNQRGLFGSLVSLGLPTGIILSNLIFLAATLTIPQADFAAWGWRIPFLASGALVILGLFVRLRVTESPLFAEALRAGRSRRLPIVDVLSHDARLVLLAAGSYLGISALGYLVIVYFVSYATNVLKLPLTTALALLLTAAVAFAISIVVTGRWSDRVGRQRVMRWGNGAIVAWALVFFPLIDTRSTPLAGLAVTVMLVLQGAYIGTQPAVFAELFPTAIRYSGASVSMTLATIAGGALAPFIATALFNLTGNSTLITVYATAVALVSWLSVLGLQETYRRNLSTHA